MLKYGTLLFRWEYSFICFCATAYA